MLRLPDEFIIFEMMKRGLTIVMLFLSSLCFGQETELATSEPYYPPPPPFTGEYPIEVDSSDYFNPRVNHPIIGIGPGILTFFGDVSDPKVFPSISRIGYNLSVSEYLSKSLLFSARAMFGQLGANEATERYYNFNTTVRAGGLFLSYNFDHFLKQKRRIDPFVTAGIEYFEFLAKTDLFDASGNRYHYWSDGSIMNMDENDPNAANAIPIVRDYNYETDLRKWNESYFGKYPERSFAVPVGIGVTFHLHRRWDFKLGANYHFTFTDYIDGVSEDNKGAGKGNSQNDGFLESYFTLSFHLFNPSTEPPQELLSNEEYLAILTEDSDEDGVSDEIDSCLGTPPGVVVDAKGCPVDTDGDRFPDYIDKEINSPPGALVDENGVALDDSTLAQKWREWSDTTNQYVAFNQVTNPMASSSDGWNKPRESTVVYRQEYVVMIGSYMEGVPPDEMDKLLNVPDVRSSVQPDSSTAYVAGSYGKINAAENRKDQLAGSGFPDAKVMVLNKDGSLSEPGKGPALASGGDNSGDGGNQNTGDNASGNNTSDVMPSATYVVYRVQLGAYSRQISQTIFSNAGDVLEMKTEDGLFKYVSGSHQTVQDALIQRGELLKRGYEGAFVVAYKEGKRVPLSSVSGGVVKPTNEDMKDPVQPNSAIDKSLVEIKVQIAAFVNDPPADVLAKLNEIPGIEKRVNRNGLTQFLVGNLKSYEDAKDLRDKIISEYNITDAFLVAFFRNEKITVQEAIELLK